MHSTNILIPTYLKRLSWLDWFYASMLVAGSLVALRLYGGYMDVYEKAILLAATITFGTLGWNWKSIRTLILAIALLSFSAIYFYQQDLSRAEQTFLLKYFLSSQSAVMWMSVLFLSATFCYWIYLVRPSITLGRYSTWLVWSAVTVGLTAMLVRWYESYLIGSDVGHIPISNLYEVFILFSIITALFYLYYEKRYQTKKMGAFVLLIISAAIGFLLWYTFSREAYAIQPLVPALQSWWMKIHVPANFIGYGSFSLAAMVALAYLLASRNILANRLPSLGILEDVMYQSIAVGFTFFTIATILGALWAAEAWGAAWQWDPKETWALIVWLNYAAWLHMRLVKGLQGTILAWWALVGLLVTTFAFLGVNMFLSGLHSYGTL